MDSPAKLNITQDELIEQVVKAELANQPIDRQELEGEFKKKTGITEDPHFAAKDATLVKTLDDPKVKPKKIK